MTAESTGRAVSPSMCTAGCLWDWTVLSSHARRAAPAGHPAAWNPCCRGRGDTTGPAGRVQDGSVSNPPRDVNVDAKWGDASGQNKGGSRSWLFSTIEAGRGRGLLNVGALLASLEAHHITHNCLIFCLRPSCVRHRWSTDG